MYCMDYVFQVVFGKKGDTMMEEAEKKKTYPEGRRCTIDLTPAAAEEVDRICNIFGLKISDLFRYSLLLMRIYGDAVIDGKQMRLVSRKDPNEVQVIEMPLFTSQSRNRKSLVSEQTNVTRTG